MPWIQSNNDIISNLRLRFKFINYLIDIRLSILHIFAIYCKLLSTLQDPWVSIQWIRSFRWIVLRRSNSTFINKNFHEIMKQIEYDTQEQLCIVLFNFVLLNL